MQCEKIHIVGLVRSRRAKWSEPLSHRMAEANGSGVVDASLHERSADERSRTFTSDPSENLGGGSVQCCLGLAYSAARQT